MIGSWIENMLRRIPRLPRKWRVVRNLICSVLLMALIWCALGPPVLTAEKALRRAAQADLSEPYEIIYRYEEEGQVYFVGSGAKEHLIGSSRLNGIRGWTGEIRHLKKNGDAVIVPLKSFESSLTALQILMFCDLDGVARAEVDITAADEGLFNGTPFNYCETYTIHFEPVADGFLTGWLYPVNSDEDTWDGYIERRALRKIFNENKKLPIEIRLYGSSGQLMLKETKEYSYPEWE